ncbi:MAG: glycosyltransferase family 2 protein [Methanogenium sp.]|jgi:cellulose synthase/poly-beta-1,6-N-acetylglucosamine synthase-like glycosyltransferase
MTCTVMNNKLVAFVPAHNEEDIIEQTVLSLINQTYKNIDIIVISDNSTDQTVPIAKQLASQYPNVRVIETIGNKYKKSGALNFAYRYLGEELNAYDFVLTMDGDTVLNSNLVEQAMIEYDLDEKLGTVCSRAGIMKQETKTAKEKYLYHCQYTEYADFDRDRLGQDKWIKVSHGMCSVYKVAAIKDVMSKRLKDGEGEYCVYKVTNITEDYELTVTIKEFGWHASTGFGMLAWTDVPVSFKELWKQRIRWFRGGIDTLWSHGVNSVTAYDFFDHFLFWFMFISQFLMFYWTYLEIQNGNYTMNRVVFIVIGIMYINNLYTLRYVQHPTMYDYILRIVYIPQVFYTWFTAMQQLYAYYLFMFKPNQEW